MQRKSQAALEFLMTYGWAILAVMMALGALAYFGVLNPSRLLPDRCLFGNGITCQDALLKTTSVNISLLNGAGQTIYNFSVSPDGFAGDCNLATAIPIFTTDAPLMVNCSITDNKLSVGQKGKVKFKAVFKKVIGGFDQVSLGEVYATVQ